jgi:hypothetical protein
MEKQNEREHLIGKIIAVELEMFQNVKSRGYAACQELPKTFRMMRWMAHSVLSDETLASYLDDLEQAGDAGRNLMTEKYARMESLIPPLKQDPEIVGIIDEIVRIEESWMREFSQEYPEIVKSGAAGFGDYLRGELETYSDRTLRLYLRDAETARQEGSNHARKSYENLFKKLGYESLDDVARQARDQE